MTWATGYMLGITTGICLQVAAVQAERRGVDGSQDPRDSGAERG